MKLSDISSITKGNTIFLALAVIVGIFFYVTHNWTKETQIFTGALVAVALLTSLKDIKPQITLEEAKIKASDWFKEKKRDNIITDYGHSVESIDGITRQRDGKDWYHEVGIQVGEKSFYVLGLSMYGKIISTTHKKTWSVRDAPNVEIITPPDFLSWYKMKKTAEQKMEEST